MRSDDEIMKLPSFALTPEEYARQGVLITQGLAKAREKQAYGQGKRDLLREQTIADDGLREDLRLQQWVRQKGHGITYDQATDTFNDVPEGWPAGVDGDQFFADFIENMFDTPATTEPQQTEDTGSVAAFNKAIGG